MSQYCRIRFLKSLQNQSFMLDWSILAAVWINECLVVLKLRPSTVCPEDIQKNQLIRTIENGTSCSHNTSTQITFSPVVPRKNTFVFCLGKPDSVLFLDKLTWAGIIFYRIKLIIFSPHYFTQLTQLVFVGVPRLEKSWKVFGSLWEVRFS